MDLSTPCEPVFADWNKLHAARAAMSERFEAQQAGGGELVNDHSIRAEGLEWDTDGTTLILRPVIANGETAWWQATPDAAGFPASWEGMETLELSASADDPDTCIRLEVAGARNLLSTDWSPAEQTLRLPLRELPLTAGHRPPFEPTALRIHVRRDKNHAQGGALRCTSLVLTPARGNTRLPVLDRYGQRIQTDWDGKVRTEADLRAHLEAELSAFRQVTKRSDIVRSIGTTGKKRQDAASTETDSANADAHVRDRSAVGRFGGWRTGTPLAATGFFRTERVGGRWLFVDPEGFPFWSLGVTGIRLSEYTPYLGREWLFEELPPTDGPESTAYMRRPLIKDGPRDCISFYHLNVLRKYASAEAWRSHLLERLPAWGFNTAGNWSMDLLDQKSIPYTRWLRTNDAGAPLIAPRFPDVFDPRWEAWFDERCAREAAPHRDDPWILGWFVDNELPWAKMDFAPPGEDPEAFHARYAKTYFEKVSRILRKHAPNHLYLGCRFVRNPPAKSIVRAAGRFCDVVTVNCYALAPPPEQFREWHETTGRPILIGEHHLPLASPRQLPPLYTAFTTAERETFYHEYLRSWATTPYSLGAHWFQWVDQVGTGRGDGENQTIGFVDVTDQPHPELLRALRAARTDLSAWLGLTQPADAEGSAAQNKEN